MSSPSALPLHGKVALVTGSTTGLGLAIARELSARGAQVALNYAHNQERASTAFTEFTAHGGKGALFQADVCDAASVASMIKNIENQLGPIDILIPNATGPQPQRPIEEYDWAFYQEMLDFFIKSPFLLTQATIAHMKAQKWGRIVNLGSEVYEVAHGNFSAYVAAKGGQKGWTHSMATELAPFGITVNMVSPGWIPTERHADDPQEAKDEYLAAIPAASFITGQTICVNGGRSPI